MKEMQKIRERLAATKPRTAWDKGVKKIAENLLDKYEEIVRDRGGVRLGVPANRKKLYLTVRVAGNNIAMAVAQRSTVQ